MAEQNKFCHPGLLNLPSKKTLEKAEFSEVYYAMTKRLGLEKSSVLEVITSIQHTLYKKLRANLDPLDELEAWPKERVDTVQCLFDKERSDRTSDKSEKHEYCFTSFPSKRSRREYSETNKKVSLDSTTDTFNQSELVLLPRKTPSKAKLSGPTESNEDTYRAPKTRQSVRATQSHGKVSLNILKSTRSSTKYLQGRKQSNVERAYHNNQEYEEGYESETREDSFPAKKADEVKSIKSKKDVENDDLSSTLQNTIPIKSLNKAESKTDEKSSSKDKETFSPTNKSEAAKVLQKNQDQGLSGKTIVFEGKAKSPKEQASFKNSLEKVESPTVDSKKEPSSTDIASYESGIRSSPGQNKKTSEVDESNNKKLRNSSRSETKLEEADRENCTESSITKKELSKNRNESENKICENERYNTDSEYLNVKSHEKEPCADNFEGKDTQGYGRRIKETHPKLTPSQTTKDPFGSSLKSALQTEKKRNIKNCGIQPYQPSITRTASSSNMQLKRNPMTLSGTQLTKSVEKHCSTKSLFNKPASAEKMRLLGSVEKSRPFGSGEKLHVPNSNEKARVLGSLEKRNHDKAGNNGILSSLYSFLPNRQPKEKPLSEEEVRKKMEEKIREKEQQVQEQLREKEEARRKQIEEKRLEREEKIRRMKEFRRQQEENAKIKAVQKQDNKALQMSKTKCIKLKHDKSEDERKRKEVLESKKQLEEELMQKEAIAAQLKTLKNENLIAKEKTELNQTFEVVRETVEDAKKGTSKTTVCESYDITPARHELPPEPLKNPDNYDINDLRSDEETDDEEQPRKEVPAWAEGSALRSALCSQRFNPPHLDELFTIMDMPDLGLMFSQQRKRFYKRTSSAQWGELPTTFNF